MKNLSIKISLAALAGLTAVMILAAVTTKAADGDGAQPEVLCDLWVENVYGRADQTTQEAMELYHKTINAKFNDYIKKMIEAQGIASETGLADPNAKAPANGVCDEDNYSTYCVSRAMLIGEGIGGRDGYMDYLKAMDCRKNRLFDTVTEETAWSDYQDAMILGEENEQDAQNALQLQRALTKSARMERIEKEIDSAKQALDVTLATYDELKTAWTMHKRYVKIYENLVIFRDKMAEIRHQVEEFPSKFIDATTTMCT